MAADSDALTRKWLVPLLLSIIGALLGAWCAWVTNELHYAERVRSQRIAEIEQLHREAADHEARLRVLEGRPQP